MLAALAYLMKSRRVGLMVTSLSIYGCEIFECKDREIAQPILQYIVRFNVFVLRCQIQTAGDTDVI